MTQPDQEQRLPRSTPEAQGIATSAVEAFLDEVQDTIHYLHSMMLLRHGHVVAEGWWSPYAPDVPHMLYSLSKSFTSSAVGLAVDEGLLSIDDSVLSFFPDETPETVSDNLSAMRVRHLLSMNTGHADDSTGHIRDSDDDNWARAFLAQPVTHEPGTHFLYDSGASYMLSAIVQKLTGQTLVDYLTPRLFEPLGIEKPYWESCPRGVNTGGWGLYLKTEDIACFGQMLLQRGEWQGRRLLPASWVDLATSYHSDNSSNDQPDWQQGYGFQFWRCQHNAYRGDGAFGQFCVVMPDQDAVFVATAGVESMQSVLDLVWKHLLPAMESDSLPEQTATAAALRERMATLAVPPVTDVGAGSLQEPVSGRKYVLEPADDEALHSLSVRFDGDNCILSVEDSHGEHELVCGRGTWKQGETTLGWDHVRRMAGSSGWQDDSTFAVCVYYYDTPHAITFTCRFDGDDIALDRRINVSFGPTELPTQTGRARV